MMQQITRLPLFILLQIQPCQPQVNFIEIALTIYCASPLMVLCFEIEAGISQESEDVEAEEGEFDPYVNLTYCMLLL